MRTSRLLNSVAIMAASGIVAITPACSEKKSAIMLAITTDMKAPKDVNAVSVTVSTNNTIRHNVVGRVTPQGDILLPATLAIVQPDEENASIRVRVMAFQERKARVMRDVRTSIPAGGRVALLRIPLNFVNDTSAQGELPVGALPAANPGTIPTGAPGSDAGPLNPGVVTSADLFDPFLFVPNCPNPEHTWINGECQDAYVDPNSLPEFDEALVGAGDQPGSCFDVKACFGNAVALQGPTNNVPVGRAGDAPPPPTASADAGTPALPAGQNIKPQNISFNVETCSVQLDASVDPSKLNIAIVTPDTGECLRPNECYIPLDGGEGGWKAENGQVKLPSFVCKLVTSKRLRLAYSAGCASKREVNPICAETAVGAPGDRLDGGGPPTTAGAQLLVAEGFATSIGFDGANFYLAGSNRISKVSVSGNTPAQQVPGIPPQKAPWIFGEASPGFVLTNGTNIVYALDNPDGSGSPLAITLPPGAVANGATFSPASGQLLIAAGPQGSLGGIYAVQQKQPTPQKIMATQIEGPMQLDEATIVGATTTGFLFGNSKGQVASCEDFGGMNWGCGVINDVVPNERANAFARRPNDVVGYGLFQTKVYRATFSQAQQGQIVGFPIAQANVSSLSIEGRNYPRAIAANDSCVFYTSAEGVSVVVDHADKSIGRVLYSAPSADKPVLGIALGPRPGGGTTGGAPSLFFTVFAPLDQGGGMYIMDVPEDCRGATLEPGPNPMPGDAGGGGGTPMDASVDDATIPPDATKCSVAGQICDDVNPCCAGLLCQGSAAADGGLSFTCAP